MTRNSITVALLVAGTWFSLPSRSCAQIASVVDDRGKLVFVNEDSPKAHGGSTISPAPAKRSAGGSINPTDVRLERIVHEAAQRHNVDPALVKAVISTESGWNPRAVSRKGAVGLMQLIPATAQRYGVGNPFDPAQNVEGGTMHLRSLLNRYNGDLTKTLAAYNAGERAVDLSHGIPGFRETLGYVRKVTDAYFRSDSGRDPVLWSAPSSRVRREVASDGRIVFTNE